MKDKQFLMWLYVRLVEVHGESPMLDYMHKLRAIISSTPESQFTPNGAENRVDFESIIDNTTPIKHD